jgi:hypothetical protein
VSPRWLQNTPSTSNGVAPKRSATACTSEGVTNRNTARGSMKRRISQGQAMRSILGRSRVTQRCLTIARRDFARRTSGSLPFPAPCHLPAIAPGPMVTQPRRRAVAQLAAGWQTATTLRPTILGPSAHSCDRRMDANEQGSASKSSVDIDDDRRGGRPMTMLVGEITRCDMVRPLLK